MDRTHVSKNAQSVLQAPSFLERVKGALELLRARNGTFGKFVARALRENADERSGAALSAWSTKAMTILSQNRLEVTCRHPTTGATNTHYFVMPDTGQEASVQSIYAVISANLSPVHFEPRFGNAALEDWCPTMFHTNNGQGLDAIGLRRRDLRHVGPGMRINFGNIPNGIPFTALQNLEFKLGFHVYPNKSSYNHMLPLTDQIICGRLSVGNLRTPLPEVLPQTDLTVRDDNDNQGTICFECTNPITGEKLTVPPQLKGYAFFINDIRKCSNGEPAPQPHERAGNPAIVRVVDVFKLIEELFRHPDLGKVVKYGEAVDEPAANADDPPSQVRKRRSQRRRPANTVRHGTTVAVRRAIAVDVSTDDDAPGTSRRHAAAGRAAGKRAAAGKKRTR